MNRAELIDDFRVQNPEVDINVISDAQLSSFLLTGDKEVCAATRCIVGDYSFTCVANAQYWDVTSLIPKFYAIDDYPGGAVCYDNKRLDLTTISELDHLSSSWRTRSAGTPKKYFMRGKYLWVDRPIETADTVQIYYAAISDDFNNDGITPYNQLLHLEPFHNALILYLTYRCKGKVGKPQEAQIAKSEYQDYVKWMKKEVTASKAGVIYFQPRV